MGSPPPDQSVHPLSHLGDPTHAIHARLSFLWSLARKEGGDRYLYTGAGFEEDLRRECPFSRGADRREMIQLRNLEQFYDTRAGRTYVLRRINLDIKQREFVTIMGPSGAGKSTSLAILGMLDSSWQREFFFVESAVHRMKPKQRVELNKQVHRFRVPAVPPRSNDARRVRRPRGNAPGLEPGVRGPGLRSAGRAAVAKLPALTEAESPQNPPSEGLAKVVGFAK